MSGYVDEIGRRIRRFKYRVSQTTSGDWFIGHWWWEASATPEYRNVDGEIEDGLSISLAYGFARSQARGEQKALRAIENYKKRHRAEDILAREIMEHEVAA